MTDFRKLYEKCPENSTESENDGDLCTTCLKRDTTTIKITDLDHDGRTFLEKLKACVYQKLEVNLDNTQRICRSCLTTLNLSYRFRKIALQSLKLLDNAVETDEDDKDVEEIKEESYYSDDHVSFSNDNEFDDDELDKAVLLITKLDNEGSNSKAGTNTDKRSYSNNKETKCEECPATFQKKTEYKEHMLNVHKQTLTCQFCGKAFRNLFKLKEHVTLHTGEKNFNCTNCDKAFSRISSLKRHMKTHYAPPGQKSKKTPFLCTICGKNFPFSNGATRHMRIHFGIKTHQCQICNKQFNQSTHLQVHMRTHSGEKPYICEICGDSFTLKAGLHKHTRTKHQQEKDKVTLHGSFKIGNDMFFN